MPDGSSKEHEFFTKLSEEVKAHCSSEQFGVSDLAEMMGMSRSNLLRKVKKQSGLSVSLFIRKIRLEMALDMLKEGSLTVSEVAFQVGFSSTSYFIKCFHDYYGLPPGEVGKGEWPREEEVQKQEKQLPLSLKQVSLYVLGSVFVALVVVFGLRYFPAKKPGKSIAVLPFKNESSDSTNVYIINGVMEAILGHLQRIEDLRVVSRTSVEQFRNSSKTIPEIAKELNVTYFIEGSGQKIGEQLLLNVQLIDAEGDKHLWAQQYNRETKDIFALQREVAKSIADEIEVVITPQAEEQMDKEPTTNLEAYDAFLKGMDFFYAGTREGLEQAIPYFEEAVAHDPAFARAYADIAIAYYFLDANQVDKKYTSQINKYADRALLADPELAQSLIAKAVFYMSSGSYELAIPYLEKALKYNPNSNLVLGFLADFYANQYPDTPKYLEYALRGLQLNLAALDSAEASINLLHVSNAFIQAGFVEQAEEYIDRSLDYDPDNLYAAYVRAYILFAKNGDLAETKSLLKETLQRDSTRLDVIQEVGKVCYYMNDYQEAFHYYQWFLSIKNAMNLDIYRFENAKIGFVFETQGLHDAADKLFADYYNYAENDQSIYKHLSLAVYLAQRNENEQALQHLSIFARQDNFHYWVLLFLKIDPLVNSIKDTREFKQIYQEMENGFWKNHEQIRKSLARKNLL